MAFHFSQHRGTHNTAAGTSLVARRRSLGFWLSALEIGLVDHCSPLVRRLPQASTMLPNIAYLDQQCEVEGMLLMAILLQSLLHTA